MTNAHPAADAIPCPACDKTARPDIEHAEPLTHCEWCGAEYPQPDEVPVADAAPRRDAPPTDR